MPTVSKINPDLKEERDRVGFNVEEFTNWYYGGADNVKEKRFFGKASLTLTCLWTLIELFFEQMNISSPTRS